MVGCSPQKMLKWLNKEINWFILKAQSEFLNHAAINIAFNVAWKLALRKMNNYMHGSAELFKCLKLNLA